MRSESEDERPRVSFAFQGEFVGRLRQGRWLMMSATAALQQNDGALLAATSLTHRVPSRDGTRCVTPRVLLEQPRGNRSTAGARVEFPRRRCVRLVP